MQKYEIVLDVSERITHAEILREVGFVIESFFRDWHAEWKGLPKGWRVHWQSWVDVTDENSWGSKRQRKLQIKFVNVEL